MALPVLAGPCPLGWGPSRAQRGDERFARAARGTLGVTLSPGVAASASSASSAALAIPSRPCGHGERLGEFSSQMLQIIGGLDPAVLGGRGGCSAAAALPLSRNSGGTLGGEPEMFEDPLQSLL